MLLVEAKVTVTDEVEGIHLPAWLLRREEGQCRSGPPSDEAKPFQSY